MTTQQPTAISEASGGSGSETLTIVDNRTGQSYELPIEDGTIRATDLRQIKVSESDFGLMTYDPAFMNTASCRSAITYLDGDNGVLRYRGYPIEQLAEKSSFLEVSYLLVNGELPTAAQLETWVDEITHHTFVHDNVRRFMQGFRYDAHPMGMLQSSVGMLSTFYPEAKDLTDEESNHLQIVRLIAKMPTLGAFAYRHITGKPYVYPNNELSYSENFLAMLFTTGVPKYAPDPRIVRALDVLFILHADHEQNCSTSAVRSVGSSQVDPYSAVAAGVSALYGPLHGGANEAVLQMLRRIEKVENIPAFIEGVKARQRAPDGLRPPRLQELRPAGHDHQEGLRRRVRGDRGQPAPRRSRCELEKIALAGRVLRQAQALPERGLLLGPDLRGRSACRPRCSPSSSPSGAPPAGWPSGSELIATRSRRSRARARSTSAPTSATTWRSAPARRS